MIDAQLQALLAVAETGSFTFAARRLRMTQSAVSHAVTSFEQSLRVTLVERAAGGARLTPVGERIVRHARGILRLKAEIEHDAEAARTLTSGRMRVGSLGVSSSRRLLPPMLDAFSARYPRVSVVVREGTDDDVEQWLRDATVDVAFVTLPSDEFDTVGVAEDRLYAVLPADHPSAADAHVAPHVLSEQPFIMSTGGCEAMVRAATPGVALDVRYSIRDCDAIVGLVGRGRGVAVVPRLALPDTPPRGVVFVPLETDHARRIGLAVRKEESEDSPARALLRLARRREARTPARV